MGAQKAHAGAIAGPLRAATANIGLVTFPERDGRPRPASRVIPTQDPAQARLLDEMRTRRYVESEEMARSLQRLCFPYLAPGFVGASALGGLFLGPFGLLQEAHLWIIAAAAACGFAWLLLVAPALIERRVFRKLGYEVRYFGRERNRSYSAFVDHRNRRFCVWDESSFTTPYRYWMRGMHDS